MTVTRRDASGRIEEREVSKDPVTAPAIERIFDLALRHRMPPAAIGRDLNRAGMLKPGRPYRGEARELEAWRARDVKRILLNPFYAGLMSYDGKERSHEFPTYVSEEDHKRLVAMHPTLKPEDGPRVKGRLAVGLVLQRLATCSCGAKMYCKTRSPRADGTRKRKYICARHGDATGLCNAHIDADYVDG